jgi:outer membrane receptor protein involved in Fe transport
MSDVGGFANLSGRAGPSLEWTLGGRADVAAASFNADDPVLTRGDSNGFPANTIIGNAEPDFRLGMAYFTAKRTINDNWSASFGAAYAMRAPELAELYSDEPFAPIARFGNSFVVGATDLDPERNLQFDLGATATGSWWTASVRAFHSTVYDYILPIPQSFGDLATDSVQGNGPFALDRRVGAVAAADDASIGYVYANIARATMFGGDASAEWRLAPFLSATGTLAYVKGTNHAPRVVGPDRSYTDKGAEGLPGIFPLTGTIGLRWFEPERERFGVEIAGRFVRAQNYTADSLGELPTPGYTVWNVRGWLRLGERVQLHTAVRNIFNADYTQHGSLAIASPTTGAILFVPEPGLSWVTSIEVTY